MLADANADFILHSDASFSLVFAAFVVVLLYGFRSAEKGVFRGDFPWLAALGLASVAARLLLWQGHPIREVQLLKNLFHFEVSTAPPMGFRGIINAVHWPQELLGIPWEHIAAFERLGTGIYLNFLFGALSPIVVYFILRHFRFQRGSCFLSGFIVAVSPWHAYFSSTYGMIIPSAFWGLISHLWLLAFIRRPCKANALLFFLSTYLFFGMRAENILFMPLQAAVLFVQFRKTSSRGYPVAYTVFFGLSIAVRFLAAVPSRYDYIVSHANPVLTLFGALVNPQWNSLLDFEHVFPGYLLLVVVGCVLGWRRRSFLSAYVCLSMLVFLVTYHNLFVGTVLGNTRYFILMFILVALFTPSVVESIPLNRNVVLGGFILLFSLGSVWYGQQLPSTPFLPQSELLFLRDAEAKLFEDNDRPLWRYHCPDSGQEGCSELQRRTVLARTSRVGWQGIAEPLGFVAVHDIFPGTFEDDLSKALTTTSDTVGGREPTVLCFPSKHFIANLSHCIPRLLELPERFRIWKEGRHVSPFASLAPKDYIQIGDYIYIGIQCYRLNLGPGELRQECQSHLDDPRNELVMERTVETKPFSLWAPWYANGHWKKVKNVNLRVLERVKAHSDNEELGAPNPAGEGS